MIRPTTQKKIDACHAEIARLIEVEKAWRRMKNLDDAHPLIQGIVDAKLRCAAMSPEQRANMVYATASFPK